MQAKGLILLPEKTQKEKVALQTWNKNSFGMVEQNIKAMEERLIYLESQLQGL